MKFFSESSDRYGGECEHCGKVLKIKKEQVISASQGYSLNPPGGIRCFCGVVHHNMTKPNNSDPKKSTSILSLSPTENNTNNQESSMPKSIKTFIGSSLVLIALITVYFVRKDPTPPIPYETLNVHRYVAEDKSNTLILVKVKVAPDANAIELKTVLTKILQEYDKNIATKLKLVQVEAYTSDANQSYLAKVAVTDDNSCFNFQGKTDCSSDSYKPTLSREERARQEEVGKFAGEMMKEAEKIRNNK